MKLYYSHISPFTRKVLATALICGLFDKIEIIDLMASGSFQPTDAFKKANPLAKIPTLVLDNGEAVVDSPVICEYLDAKSVSGSIYPQDENAYFLQKKFEAIADGCMDAAVLRRYESLRPVAQQSAEFDHKQKEKMQLSFKYFESVVSKLGTDKFYIGEISIISMIGYADYRFATENWLAETPNLKKWYDQVRLKPLFVQTEPKK